MRQWSYYDEMSPFYCAAMELKQIFNDDLIQQIIDKDKDMNFSYHFRMITNNSGQFVKYLTLQQDVAALRGQMLYRARNLGMKELDMIVGSWATNFINNMNKQQLLQFNKQVLQQETPDLVRKLLGYQQIDETQKVVQSIRNFALDDKHSKLID